MSAVSGLLRFLSALIVLSLVGCASGGSPASQAGAGLAPSIILQPANQSVPMGLTGSFTVKTVGPNLQFQWSRNGSPISGATASTYTTAPTAFSDTASTFTVIVSNPAGFITSQAASLTVTARAPKAGDLRFQQVDAVSTVNGYTVQAGFISNVACPPPGGGGSEIEYSSSTGTAFFLTNNACIFQFSPFALPAGVTGLEVGYAGEATQNYQSVLDTPIGNGPAPNDPGSVITSLSFIPSANTAALGFIHSDTSSGFDRATYTVPASSLQAAATEEGLRGRVVTAISYDGTQATFFSYGWTGDLSTVYDVKVVFTTLATATDLVKGLANDGYILTASRQYAGSGR